MSLLHGSCDHTVKHGASPPERGAFYNEEFMRPSPDKEKELKRKESERLVAEYLAKGGKITQATPVQGKDPYGKSWKDRPRYGVTSLTVKETDREYLSSD